jgi:N-acetylglucosaminyl-diphospho-decaprenol L-rhamnosyltransferase
MDLSIIIINWNSAEYVKSCLGSLFKNTKGIDFEVIVIDNGSFDSCESIIRNQFPKVRFFQSNDNLGFAKANNYGSEKATGEYLLFLNPDTEIIDDVVAGMLSMIKTLQNAGVLGCRLLNSDRSLQASCIQLFPTILNQVFDSDIINRWLPVLSTGRVEYSKREPTKVQVIPGACMMIRKKIFEEVGKFSPEYFMYTEDLDLCYKAHQAGYSNYYTGAFSVIHHGGGSSHQRKENSYGNIQMRESIFKFFQKTRGKFYAGLYKKAMLLNGVMRFGMLSFAFAASMLIGHESKLKSSLIKWKAIIRWTLGIENWAH